MSFILPAEYDSMEKVPKPMAGTDVKVKSVGEQDMAVLSFSGLAGEEVVAEKTRQLESLLQADGITNWVTGSAILNQYNPPWTIPFLRLNEIGLLLKEPFE
jgi:hypothetical protein